MKKESFILISILLLFCVSIAGEITIVNATNDVLDVLEVSSNGTSIVSNIALQNEVNYEIVVSGVYYTGGNPIINNAHDAMYATQNNWATHTNEQSGLYIDQWTVGSKQWGAYNSEHIYRYTLIGNGSKISFRIHASSYNDNSGSLNIQILGSPTAPTPTPTATPSESPSTNPPASSGSTPNTPASSGNSPTNTPSTSPIPTNGQSDNTQPPKQTDPPFRNTFVIVTFLIVTVVVATILMLILRKK